MSEQDLRVPREANQYKGEFIVFFSDEENPEILFHSVIAEEAYKKSQQIKEETKREPLVIRVPEDIDKAVQLLLKNAKGDS